MQSASRQPLFFVFHGGSGSEKHHIATALGNGVCKMNVDTDTQWAYWEGLWMDVYVDFRGLRPL